MSWVLHLCFIFEHVEKGLLLCNIHIDEIFCEIQGKKKIIWTYRTPICPLKRWLLTVNIRRAHTDYSVDDRKLVCFPALPHNIPCILKGNPTCFQNSTAFHNILETVRQARSWPISRRSLSLLHSLSEASSSFIYRPKLHFIWPVPQLPAYNYDHVLYGYCKPGLIQMNSWSADIERKFWSKQIFWGIWHSDCSW